MKNILISRARECAELQRCLESDRSELVIVHGRRRIGKTYLIDNFFHNKFDFSFVGEYKTATKVQIQDFVLAIQRYSKAKQKLRGITSWYDAFHALEDYLETLPDNHKKVIFIDEMPWMDAQRSNFVNALENFWNGWANRRGDIMLIATGSATSWMRDKIVGNKGGLHARVTCNLKLSPFTLHETEEYLRAHNCPWDHYQIMQCYMALGGVPFYLSLLDTRLSVAQNIDNLFFAPEGALRREFEELYSALFNKAECYIEIVKLLAEHREGLTREQIVRATRYEGSFLSKVLLNLERCDFIERWAQYGNKVREQVFRLMDFYTLFHYKFIAHDTTKNPQWWSQNLDSPSVKTWMGISFENICMAHHQQIRKALGLQAISTALSTWHSKPNLAEGLPGMQIDMIIERADRMIHLCEMKFSEGTYTITKDYEMRLRERMGYFRTATKNKKSLLHTFITTYGITDGKHKSIVHSEVTMDDLFEA